MVESEMQPLARMSSSEHILGPYGSRRLESHPFSNPEIADYYRELYNRTNYEGRAHFDPDFAWEPAEERQLLRKTELMATGWAFIMFIAMNIDRSNMSNAVSSTILGDLGLTTSDYNLGAALNLIAFMAAEIPSQILTKQLGPDVWIPIQMCLWSIVAISQSFMTGRLGFLACRVALGALEGGFIPEIILWLSYFYTGPELSVRIGYFYLANPVSHGISALLAFLIFHLDGVMGIKGWRYLFAIEGLITFAIGVISHIMMVPSAVETKTWFKPDGWYTKRQEKIMVNRILRDDPSKGEMHNREALSSGHILQSLTDYNMWPIIITRFFNELTPAPLNLYLTIMLRSMGFPTLIVNLLLIPPAIGSIVTNLTTVHLSKRFHEHGAFMVLTATWVTIGLGVMKIWDGFLLNQWGSYILLAITLSYPFPAPLTVSWASANSNSVSGRTISASTVNIASQVAGVVASNIFRPDDAPLYHRGISTCYIIGLTAIVISISSRFYFSFQNKRRDAIWSSLSPAEQLSYLTSTADKGNNKIDFQFAV